MLTPLLQRGFVPPETKFVYLDLQGHVVAEEHVVEQDHVVEEDQRGNKATGDRKGLWDHLVVTASVA